MSFTRVHLSFENAGNDLDVDPIAIGKVGSTTVYKYNFQFPSSMTSSNDVYASASLGARALLSTDGEIVPYNLTCGVSAVSPYLYAEVLLHIYGEATYIALTPSANTYSDIANLEINLEYITEP